MLYKIYIFLNIILLYGYLYITPLLYFFYKNMNIIRKKYFSNYLQWGNIVSKRIGFYNIVEIDDCKIDDTKNLIIMNHTSIIDNLIISKLFEKNNLNWNHIRTVSRLSSRKIQNKTLELHDSLLIDKNIQNDIKQIQEIRKKWSKKNNAQIILFPEGIIYQKSEYLKQKPIKILEKIYKYKNVLNPKNGILNLIYHYFKKDIKTIYDITTVFLDKDNKKINGELNILNHLASKNLLVKVKVEKYDIDKLADEEWIYNLWEKKDVWIKTQLHL